MYLLDAKVVFNRQVAKKEIFFLLLEAQNISLKAKPGQFVMLKPYPADICLLRRPFSICLSFPEKGLFAILYTIRGKITKYMSSLEKGDTVSVIGPLGKPFKLPEDISDLILLGGGIGIAPLISFLPAYWEKAHFIAGFRSFQDYVDVKEIFPGEYEYIVATEDGSKGYKGTSLDLFKQYIKKRVFNNAVVISCGPAAMLKKLSKICEQTKLPCYVSVETRMACGIGLCQGCAIETNKGYKRVCKEGPIFKADEICWEKIQD